MNKISKLTISVITCLLAGSIGSFFTTPSIRTWYATIQRPALAPPNWIFGPVWTVLYVLMAVSAFLIWEKGIKKVEVKTSLYVFGIQLALNSLWSILFFGMHSPVLAFIEIIALWLAILLTIVKFYRLSTTAAYLLLPYLIWVSFAAFLNFSFWILNR